MDTIGKLLGLSIVGQLALHPDGIGIGSIGIGAVDGATAATLVSVVTFAGARRFPVEVNVLAGQGLCESSGLGVALALGFSVEFLNGGSLVGQAAGIDDVGNCLGEELDAGLGHPLLLNGGELVAKLSALLGGNHEVVEGFQVGVGATLDEGVVSGVDGGGDEGGSFGIGTSNGQKIGSYWPS
jgi:hypothetical protein